MIEFWGGVECTRARVGDAYRDQVEETGHRHRPDDLDRIASLGIRTVRYPVLWETVSPAAPAMADFGWHDARLHRLQELGIGVVAGLCHHGSGPSWTNLLDPLWPDHLARHALAVARRYPHLDRYTPVNEPLTTARFSCLYGHWYPHATSYAAFLPALVAQCKATVLAMRAIRTVRPDAQLVQTDDLGKTFSTPLLAYQARHENERRWLSFDLLCGRIDRQSPWWPILLRNGVSEADLALLLEGDATPDIIGVNHYLTSERYLDETLSRYPQALWGGNGHHRYADAEAVRLPIDHRDLGPAARLREAWARYGIPIAVTEVHHGCSRDDQLRWLMEVWRAAHEAAAEGADIRAVTVWSLFGTVDWSSILTRRDGHYEAGPFDVRGPVPRPTVLAAASAALATRGDFDHPVLDRAGWWKRQERFYRHDHRGPATCRLVGSPREILITGASGTLGQGFSRIASARGLDHVLTSRRELDIAEAAQVEAVLDRVRPWAVVNAAGFARPAAPGEGERCLRENAAGAEILARACARRGIPLVTFSSDLVFDGRKGAAYVEDDGTSPVCPYGASKAEAERRVLSAWPRALVIRTSAFFGPWDTHNLLWQALADAARGCPVAARPGIVTPTYVPDLVHEALNLLIDGAEGIRHLANQGETSWHGFLARAVERTGLDPDLVAPAEPVDRNTALTTGLGQVMPSLDSALERFLREVEIPYVAAERGLAAAG